MMSQRWYYDEALKHIAERDETFMEIMTGPNPLTPEEIATLIKKRPERYGRYHAWTKGENHESEQD